jgi:MFS family permease
VAAQNSNWMLCARILAGVGTGGISAVIPVWSSELVAHDSRGAVIAFEMVVNYAGISSACEITFTILLSVCKLTGTGRLA